MEYSVSHLFSVDWPSTQPHRSTNQYESIKQIVIFLAVLLKRKLWKISNNIVISQSHVRPPSFYSFIRKCLLEIIIFSHAPAGQYCFYNIWIEYQWSFWLLCFFAGVDNSFNNIYHRNSVKNPQNVLWEWYFPMNIYEHILLLIRRNMRCLFFRSFVRSPTFVNEPP